MVRLVFLGELRALAPPEWAAVDLPAGVRTLADLRAWLARELPTAEAAFARTVKMAVNLTLVHDLSTPVSDGDEVAFMPPMSGG